MKSCFVLAILVCVGLTVSAQKNDDISDELCYACEELAKLIQESKQRGIPLEEVDEKVRKLCHLLPGFLEVLCDYQLIPDIDQMYNQTEDISPRDQCVKLELCNN
ncbi:uncharacterized protein LOC114329031 [Diabrotica virgifera virgifera]|uniref:Saposin B-type domain-containing protein n=1 Tax=Diabrotica virgifera virgifera TaxID=50390 RepID=A0ABM5IIW8_DIAVI|nr:uncharacterized protein LOC114329031 [Diabrotica virgifera virgifera]